MTRISAVLAILFVWTSCGNQPTIIPVRNLDRPSDMAFICAATTDVGGQRVVTGRPMTTCNPRTRAEPTTPGTSRTPRTLGTFAVVTNTGRGEVAAIDLERGLLADLDPSTPGYGMVPVGKFPEVVSATADGCRLVTANRGSCDLSVVDSSQLVASQFLNAAPATEPGPTAAAVVITANERQVPSAPYDLVMLPGATSPNPAGSPVCSRDTEHHALVSFPSCDLVAVVRVPKGDIRSAVVVDANGARVVDPAAISCPADCLSNATVLDGGTPSGPDGGTVDGDRDGGSGGEDAGAGATPPRTNGGRLGIGPLALVPDGKRVFVGGTSADFLTVLEIESNNGAPPTLRVPAQGSKVTLHENPRGTTRLRLSVDPFAQGEAGTLGRFVGTRGNFLYAFALDGSVRVVGLDTAGTAGVECDVNVRPSGSGQTPAGCIPVSEQTRGNRLPQADGPGLRLPLQSASAPPAFPRDISFVELPKERKPNQGNEIAAGALGYLLGSNGAVYIVNIDPLLRGGARDPAQTHSFRNDQSLSRAVNDRGPAVLLQDPVRTFAGVDVPFPTRGSFETSAAGPRIETFPDDASTIAGYSRGVVLPPALPIIPQRWTVTWEDVLPGTERRQGVLELPQPGAGAACTNANSSVVGCLADVAASFCRQDVRAGDVLSVRGCLEDRDCFAIHEDRCLQLTPGSPGLCVPSARRGDAELLRICSRQLASRQRYEIVRSTPQRLELGLKLDELPRPGVAPCATDDDCRFTSTRPGEGGFVCRQVRAGEARRCVRPCGSERDGGRVPDDRLCRSGFVCEDVGSTEGPLCVEGPPPNPACWPDETHFWVQAGRSFVVQGNATPRPSGVVERGGVCAPDPSANAASGSRISLDAPACGDLAANLGTPRSVAAAAVEQGISSTTSMGNVCLLRGPNADAPGASDARWKAVYDGPQTRFVLTNLDQFAGDGLQLSFSVIGGLRPDVVDITTASTEVTVGARIITGPTRTPESQNLERDLGGATPIWLPYVYVVDQGRTLAGGRGQVHRINPRTDLYPSGRFDSLNLNETWPIQ